VHLSVPRVADDGIDLDVGFLALADVLPESSANLDLTVEDNGSAPQVILKVRFDEDGEGALVLRLPMNPPFVIRPLVPQEFDARVMTVELLLKSFERLHNDVEELSPAVHKARIPALRHFKDCCRLRRTPGSLQ
jgi:hypothetical protein